ncbi:MAG: hypothetical protein MK076_05910 [Flavobacteriales bacterium]|nr:hypothetical protein [Flavobacteriales bacterium]
MKNLNVYSLLLTVAMISFACEKEEVMQDFKPEVEARSSACNGDEVLCTSGNGVIGSPSTVSGLHSNLGSGNPFWRGIWSAVKGRTAYNATIVSGGDTEFVQSYRHAAALGQLSTWIGNNSVMGTQFQIKPHTAAEELSVALHEESNGNEFVSASDWDNIKVTVKTRITKINWLVGNPTYEATQTNSFNNTQINATNITYNYGYNFIDNIGFNDATSVGSRLLEWTVIIEGTVDMNNGSCEPKAVKLTNKKRLLMAATDFYDVLGGGISSSISESKTERLCTL